MRLDKYNNRIVYDEIIELARTHAIDSGFTYWDEEMKKLVLKYCKDYHSARGNSGFAPRPTSFGR